jgi:hypothetical protein
MALSELCVWLFILLFSLSATAFSLWMVYLFPSGQDTVAIGRAAFCISIVFFFFVIVVSLIERTRNETSEMVHAFKEIIKKEITYERVCVTTKIFVFVCAVIGISILLFPMPPAQEEST